MENKRYKKEQDIHLTKEEYLAQLKKYLKRLPKEDYNNAMDYFTEYFEDARFRRRNFSDAGTWYTKRSCL